MTTLPNILMCAVADMPSRAGEARARGFGPAGNLRIRRRNRGLTAGAAVLALLASGAYTEASASLFVGLEFDTPGGGIEDLGLEAETLGPGERLFLKDGFDFPGDRNPRDPVPPGEASGTVSATRTIQRASVDASVGTASFGPGFLFGDVFADAQTQVRDKFHITGDGFIEFSYSVTGSFDIIGRKYSRRGWSSVIDELGMFFSVRLGRGRFPFFDDSRATASVEFSNEKVTKLNDDLDKIEIERLPALPGQDLNILNIFPPTERIVTLRREVSNGDRLFYNAFSQAIIELDDFFGRAEADFGSTAELFNVFTSEGVSFTAESGFDYMSVQGSPPGGNQGTIPLPGTAWFLLAGLGGLIWTGRRSGRSGGTTGS